MSSGSTLFAHIAPRLTNRVEDVAVDALGYILSQSGAARKALADTLKTGGILVDSIERVQTQAVGEKGERPDLVGFGQDNVEHVMIEAKFWAGLTASQPNDYLERFAPKQARGASLRSTCRAARNAMARTLPTGGEQVYIGKLYGGGRLTLHNCSRRKTTPAADQLGNAA